MPPTRNDSQWDVIGHTQRGASHERQSTLNQDAIAFYVLPDGSPPIILAVADGHGSTKTFRSRIGAWLAVKSAVRICKEFAQRFGNLSPSAVKNAAEQHIAPPILRTWNQRVANHFAK
jgi:serine/threonine protein phosphatase PrpC